jgi:hypothetical protein
MGRYEAPALPSRWLLAIYGRVSRVPPRVSGGQDQPPRTDLEQLEHLEELGDDAIIAQQQGAHVPKPRAQVTEEARSIVISDHPGPGSDPPDVPKIPADPSVKKRSERTEKTVVIRDRRQIEELRREMAKRKPKPAPPPSQGLLLWVIVGVAAFLTGGLVALIATREDASAVAVPAPAVSELAKPTAAPVVTVEPPSVSIDELPIEGGKKK